MAHEFDDAARKVDQAQVHLRWCIESGESEYELLAARESLMIADETFDQAIAEATVTEREQFIIAKHGIHEVCDSKRSSQH